MSINETVLEMHYHRALINLFAEAYGLGHGKFNFFKYSPQRECFVGFDQAFVKTDLSEEEFFQKLKAAALTKGYKLTNFIVGYFLQYKVVKVMQNRVRHTPSFVKSMPHQRVALDTAKNITTGFSQHELLFNLSRNYEAFVYYACPMIFERTHLYSDPDLDLLRLTDVSSCPSDYSDNEKHFIYFDGIEANPIWCSEPVEGKAVSSSQFVASIVAAMQRDDFQRKQLDMYNYLSSPIENKNVDEKMNILKLVSESLVFVEYQANESA